MKLFRWLVVFSYGLFSIGAQTLLFREYITTFEGSDVSVGIFFACWFLWVALGAVLVYRLGPLGARLAGKIELLLLVYLPAFVLQLFLIIQVRTLAGIESYALVSIPRLVLLSVVINAPVSVITGMLFPLFCRRLSPTGPLTVSGVYTLEAAGSFVGGLGTTLLLGVGFNSVKVFLLLAFVVFLSAFFSLMAKTAPTQPPVNRKYRKMTAAAAFLLCLCAAAFVGTGLDNRLARSLRILKWSKLLPADAYAGSFRTAQAEYLFGQYRDQWLVMRQGTVVEAVPDEAASAKTGAIALCQNPKASRVLVVGSGLALCRTLLKLPQISNVTWAHSDSEYIRKVASYIPAKFRLSDDRFEPFAGDLRATLTKSEKTLPFDIVIVNLPGLTNSVLNRYYTVEFYKQLKQNIARNGILAVHIAGGANVMGAELVSIGASTLVTLEKVFPHIALAPGEDTWFIASDSPAVTGKPGLLRDRFAAIPGAAEILSPQALLSIYLPDRAEKAMAAYRSADLPARLLLNSDSRPLTHLYSLLLAAKQSQAPVTRFVKLLALAGPLVLFIPILLFVALRVFYIRGTTGAAGRSSFDGTYLVFSAGLTGIGLVIVLMYMYQVRFGSLYLYIGVISSLYMTGLALGAALCRGLLRRLRQPAKTMFTAEYVLFAVVAAHSVLITIIAFWPGGEWFHTVFAAAFVLTGLCGGCYFPIADSQLTDAGLEAGRTGSKLELADHLGAAAGGLLTGLLLVPVAGTMVTLLVLTALLVSNVPAAALNVCRRQIPGQADTTAGRLRRFGYTLFGAAAMVVLCSNLLVSAGAKLKPALTQSTAQPLAAEMQIEPVRASLENSDRTVNYFNVYDPQKKLTGYIFSSAELAPQVRGFGGKINLAIYIDKDGKLLDFHIIRSNETPAYLDMLGGWLGSLKGHRLFGARPFAGLDTVTGATVSSQAVLASIGKSARRFAADILGRSVEQTAAPAARHNKFFDITAVYLTAAVIFTLLVIFKGGLLSRLLVLCFNLAVGGFLLNTQYSSEQVATILSGHIPAVAFSGVFLLGVGILVLVILLGNIYCGYLCPFGALQELAGYVLPKRFRPSVHPEQMLRARFIKYIVLFVFVVLFFISRDRTILAADPLIAVFSTRFWVHNLRSPTGVLVIAVLVGSVFYGRFWCRYLCPAGAFLSLFNKITILRHLLPARHYGNCEFGVTAADRLDCIYCDRCRGGFKAPTERADSYVPASPPAKALSRYLVLAAAITAIYASGLAVVRFNRLMHFTGSRASAISASGGQPRDVDLRKIEKMIKEKKLSDKEADYYKKIE